MCSSTRRFATIFIQRSGWLLLPLCVVSLIGCSSGEKPSYAVSGKVTLDGQPVPGGAVLLVNEAGTAASAALGPDGAYTLKCPAGTYRVAVSPPPPPDPLLKQAAPTTAAASAIPLAYQEVSTSKITVEVKDGNVTLDVPLNSNGGT